MFDKIFVILCFSFALAAMLQFALPRCEWPSLSMDGPKVPSQYDLQQVLAAVAPDPEDEVGRRYEAIVERYLWMRGTKEKYENAQSAYDKYFKHILTLALFSALVSAAFCFLYVWRSGFTLLIYAAGSVTLYYCLELVLKSKRPMLKKAEFPETRYSLSDFKNWERELRRSQQIALTAVDNSEKALESAANGLQGYMIGFLLFILGFGTFSYFI